MTGDKKFDANALAIQYGEHYKIPRRDKESNENYRNRVAGELKRIGKPIEAHEAYSGRRYDDPEQGDMGPLTGIIGAVALARAGRNFSPNNPENQIGDDLAMGAITRFKRDDRTLETLFATLGPSAGMDFLEATRKKY